MAAREGRQSHVGTGSSSRTTTHASAAGAGAAGAPPVTPAAKSRRKSTKQLSAKQWDKIARNLAAVQRSTQKGGLHHTRGGSADSPLEGDELLANAGADADAGLAARRRASWILEEVGEGEGEGEGEGDAGEEVETVARLYRRTAPGTTGRGLAAELGKGPDGAALAKAAARGLKGKSAAPVDSFLHEASFVFNPLNRRVPPPSPQRKALASRRAGTAPSAPTAVPSSSQSAERRSSSAAEVADRQASKVESASRPAAAASASASDSGVDEPTSLGLADKEIQEALILEDLLFVLMGIEGQYIQYAPDYAPEDVASRLRGATFTVDPALDPSLSDLVERILPLATYFTSIYAFIETDSSLEYGTVTHALCAAIRDLLKEYEVLVVQLEHQLATSPSFTLQKLWFYVHPTLHTLSLMHSLTSEIASITHADVLEEDEESSAGSQSDDSSSSSEGSMERERRQLLGLDDMKDEEGVEGGIVKGGEVLSMLWDRITRMGGDPSALNLYTTLFQRASQPYARTLIKWISTGHLSDSYEEFFVVEDPNVTRASLESDPTDEYWERRYTLRDENILANLRQQRRQGLIDDSVLADDEHGGRGRLTGGAKIPNFLEPWKHQILLAGKYLNVIRECGIEVKPGQRAAGALQGSDAVPDYEEELIVMNDESFFRRVEDAYKDANSTLLHLLIHEQHIVERLRSLKHYFFLDQSDFFMAFLEQAARELRKFVLPHKVRETTTMRLQTHLGMVLGSSSSVGFGDPYREDVRVDMAVENAYDQLKRIAETKGGIEAAKQRAREEKARQKQPEAIRMVDVLQFDLAVKFPVSLIISKKNILRWQFIQRSIIHLKVTERQLGDMWLEHQDDMWRSRTRDFDELERWKLRVSKMRHRMLFFVQQVLAFVTGEVLEPNWRDLETKMAKAKTVDQFMRDHFEFLNTCRKECMLTDLRFLEYHSRLMTQCSLFYENRVRFRDQLALARSKWEAQKGGPEVGQGPRLDADMLSFLEKFEKSWEKTMRTFRDVVTLLSTTDNPAALPLSYRLQSATL